MIRGTVAAHALPTRAARLLAIALLAALTAAPAHALTILTADKRARSDASGVTIRVGRDRALASIPDPSGCPAATSVRIAYYPTSPSLVVGPPPAELPCAGWKRIRGGWLYRDDAAAVGGIRRVRLTTRGLAIHAVAPAFATVPGPLGFLHSFRRNDAEAVITRRPSATAARAEAAFWDTLFGDARRDDEALRLLARAERRDPRDGRVPFLRAMMHLYRFGDGLTHYPSAGPEKGKEIDAAREAFARAVPRLYANGVGDTRAAGFASGTTYVAGVLADDAALRAQGLAEMQQAADVNPLFNAFNPIGVIPPSTTRDDPAYDEALRLLDDYFPIAAAECVSLNGTQGEICFNDGLAAHNLEGTFVFFGDVYAKAGRIEDARARYEAALGFAQTSGWNPVFIAEVEERLADLEGRVARFLDDDPSNDPPMLGVANGGCAHCHYR
jgi:tetratricopeptide (TPR) repeat protein